MRVPLQGAPANHGWALRYVSGVPDFSGEKQTLYLTDWRPTAGKVTFGWGDNPWLWEKEDEARKIVELLRSNCEIETDAVHV
jgi:hypothetical protein